MDYVQLLRFTGFGLRLEDDDSDGSAEKRKSSSSSTADRLSRDILRARVEEVPIDALEIPPLTNTRENPGRIEALGHTDTKLIWTSDALNGDNASSSDAAHTAQMQISLNSNYQPAKSRKSSLPQDRKRSRHMSCNQWDMLMNPLPNGKFSCFSNIQWVLTCRELSVGL